MNSLKSLTQRSKARSSGGISNVNNPQRKTRQGWKLLLIVLSLLSLNTLLAFAEANSPSQEKQLARLATLSKPAVVMIESVFTEQVTIRLPVIHASGGAIEMKPSQFPPVTLNATDQVEGSGFVATPDGYIVTNAHVVTVDDQVKKALNDNALQQFIQEEQSWLLQQLVAAGDTPDVANQLQETFAQYFAQNEQLGQVQRQIFIEMGVVVPGVLLGPMGHPSSVVVTGEVTPGKDVAVLKMEGQNFPTLPVGDDSSLSQGDSLFVMGYPAAVTFSSTFKQGESEVEPTLTSGILSRRVTMQGGWDALQTTADITNGNSGGPVLDSTGRVIGIATFYIATNIPTGNAEQPNIQQQVPGANFIVPISVVKEFLNQANVHSEESAFTKMYRQALDQYDQQHYNAALALFGEINNISPGYPDIQKYISSSQKAVVDSQYRSGLSTLRYIPFAAAGLVLLLVGLVVFLKLYKRIRLGELIKRHRPTGFMVLLAAALLLAVVTPSFGAVGDQVQITLKSGATYSGTITAETDTTITLTQDKDLVSISKADIAEIKKKPGPGPQPPNPGPGPSTLNEGLGLTFGAYGGTFPGGYATIRLGDLAIGIGDMRREGMGVITVDSIPVNYQFAGVAYFGLLSMPRLSFLEVRPSLLVGVLGVGMKLSISGSEETAQGQGATAIIGAVAEVPAEALAKVPVVSGLLSAVSGLQLSLGAWVSLNAVRINYSCYPESCGGQRPAEMTLAGWMLGFSRTF